MVEVMLNYIDGTTEKKLYDKLSLALEETRANLLVGESFKMYEDNKLLASGLISDYKEFNYED